MGGCLNCVAIRKRVWHPWDLLWNSITHGSLVHGSNHTLTLIRWGDVVHCQTGVNTRELWIRCKIRQDMCVYWLRHIICQMWRENLNVINRLVFEWLWRQTEITFSRGAQPDSGEYKTKETENLSLALGAANEPLPSHEWRLPSHKATWGSAGNATFPLLHRTTPWDFCLSGLRSWQESFKNAQCCTFRSAARIEHLSLHLWKCFTLLL